MKLRKMLTFLCAALLSAGASALLLSCDGDSAGEKAAVVKFNVNTEFATNTVKDKEVTVGKRVSKPKAYILDENPTNLQLYGWYTTPDCTTAWDFKNDRVQGNMTLYAKWVELYEVDYYTNGEFLKTEYVFNGDYLLEEPTLVEGYKYLGTYTDAAHETAFDYSKPIVGQTDLYLKRSEGLYLSDGVEEGMLSSGKLTDYLVAYVGSDTGKEEEGWVEEYTVQTAYDGYAAKEACTYVNFGYNPTYGDGFVELCLPFDITQSQIIRVWFKNLGGADSLNAYFTTMLDVENNIYSETGPVYTQDFCYPNYTGSSRGPLDLADEQMYMDETEEWTYVDFPLYEIYKNGYSVWGTSPYLGALRLQANYKNKDEEDWSNVFLIKAIEGLSAEIAVEDSGNVSTKLAEAQAVTEAELKESSSAQEENPQGFVFPKDRESVGNAVGNTELYQTQEGLLFYSENEILGREKDDPSTGFTVNAPEGKTIDLGEYTTFNITLCNYGYATNMIVYVYNDEGIPVKTELEIGAQMTGKKTYTVNLYGQFGMEGALDRVELLYTSVGVDNLIAVESIAFGEFMPYDIVGINFNDKDCYGFTSIEQVAVSFDSGREGALFSVSESGASVVTGEKSYRATTDGYTYAILHYYLPANSSVSAITAEYKIGGAFTTPYRYELDTQNKGKVKTVSLPFAAEERGFVEALKLTFEGTGNVLIKKIEYAVGKHGLPYYQSYKDIYNAQADWLGAPATCTYEYDAVADASVFTKSALSSMIASTIYIGYSAQRAEHLSVPHTTMNVPVTEKTVIKIVYQNKTDVATMNVIAGFDKNEYSPGDGSGLPILECYNLAIDHSMGEYEWSTLTVEVPTSHVGQYLAKVHWQFLGKEISIRAIAIETE